MVTRSLTVTHGSFGRACLPLPPLVRLGEECSAAGIDLPLRTALCAAVASRGVANKTNDTTLATWTIHGEELIDDSRRLKLSIASVELPDGVTFEQYVFRMPKAAMTVVLDNDHVLMIWRHRFILDQWVWELPGGYADPHEEPSVTAAREVEEETGWRPRSIKPFGSFQPITGTADFENLLFLAEGAEDTGKSADVNETARVAWIPLVEIPDRIARGEIPGAAAQIALYKLLATRQR